MPCLENLTALSNRLYNKSTRSSRDILPPEGRPVLDKKAERLKKSYTCTNPYAGMVDECNQRFEAQKREVGDSRPYAQGERSKATVEEKKAFLTESFRKGEVPELFYSARMAQLNKGEINAKLPPFFASDDLPDVNEYIEDAYGKDAVKELSTQEKEYI